MKHDDVIELLKDFRSYEFAAFNCGRLRVTLPNRLLDPQRDPDGWDQNRYNRIVRFVRSAVDEVLSDDQRTIIMRKYLDRNTLTLNEIASVIHKDKSTVTRWHKEAIRRLVVALQPLGHEELEITTFDHMFDVDGKWKGISA
ncbi:sigma-70 RNA polymerase sigma factor region 4 domain-containing protein [Paenibacillus sp. CAU 1782]